MSENKNSKRKDVDEKKTQESGIEETENPQGGESVEAGDEFQPQRIEVKFACCRRIQ
jgi:hypothetical protein